jgi:hypothetical protein
LSTNRRREDRTRFGSRLTENTTRRFQRHFEDTVAEPRRTALRPERIVKRTLPRQASVRAAVFTWLDATAPTPASETRPDSLVAMTLLLRRNDSIAAALKLLTRVERTCWPATPPLPGVPDVVVPEVVPPGAPDVVPPEVPDVPEVPEVPEVPDVPEVPEVPEVPDVPEVL